MWSTSPFRGHSCPLLSFVSMFTMVDMYVSIDVRLQLSVADPSGGQEFKVQRVTRQSIYHESPPTPFF